MCGIAGILDPAASTRSEDLRSQAASMATALEHRGPDDSGTWVDELRGVALAHRRLEVVGRGPQGRQPMSSQSGRWVLSYNGELYNATALRARLMSDGVVFRGTSDTEVLVAGIDRWGLTEALHRIEGMFAFAAWDTHAARLHLVRDRFGEKPLYYGWAGSRFVFASELKAFHALRGFAPVVDRDAVAEFLRLSCVPAPACIYRGLAKLAPGSRVSVHAGIGVGRLPAQENFWSAQGAIEDASEQPLLFDDGAAADLLENALSGSVKARMLADVPIGALLSGGIDSSLIVALMQQHARSPVRTFTVAFVDQAFDESTSASSVAAHLGTDHTTVEMHEQDVLDIIPRLPEIWDEPFSDSSQIPTFLVAGVARQAVTVALSGDGGDELFAGYNRHAWLARIWRVAGPVPNPLRRSVGEALRRLPPGAVDALAKTLPSRWQVRLPSTKVEKLGRVLTASSPQDAYDMLRTHWADPSTMVLGAAPQSGQSQTTRPWATGEIMDGLLRSDLMTYLPDDVLTKVDRASMAVSLETRAPFLDRGVLEVAWRLPQSSKLRDGTSKWMLRQVLLRHVPASLVDRPKMGFGAPLGDWLRGPLRPWAEELLSTASVTRHGLLDPVPVRRAWRLHVTHRRDLSEQLWDVLSLEGWMAHWGTSAN
jgi:asparagine synthase (glutamine-hydrolysing)